MRLHVLVLILAASVLGACGKPDPSPADGGTPEDAGVPDGGDPITEVSFGLSYRYGNQIYGSQLEMKDDFTLVRTERTCCPPTFTDGGTPDVGPEQALDLYSWTRACATSPTQRLSPDGGGAAGDLYGRFELRLGDGGAVILRREELEDGGHIVERNTCADLPKLLGFVNGIIDVDMPVAQ